MVESLLRISVEYAPLVFLLFIMAPSSAAFTIATDRGWTKEYLFPVAEWLALAGAMLGLLAYVLVFSYIDQL